MVNDAHAALPGNEPQPLLSVHVDGSAHDTARSEALAKLRTHGAVAPAMVDSVNGKLSAFDHAWRPDLTDFDKRYDWAFDSPQRRVETFIYGGLLFGYFAEQAKLPHLLQATRANLEEAVALDVAPTGLEGETRLDEELGKLLASRLAVAGLEATATRGLPPVLPYLLTHYQPQSPQERVLRALELRRTDMMGEYRDWRNSRVRAFQQTLTVAPDLERDIASVADAIQAARAGEPRVHLCVQVRAGAERVGTVSGIGRYRAFPGATT